jgi:hypothetical protein
MPKRTMTLNLTEKEMQVIEKLAQEKDLSKTALIRQAIRMYQIIEARIANGEKLFVEDSEKQKTELMVL